MVHGVAYPGFIKSLEKNHIREGLEYVTGSSTGAIVATMTAVGCSGEHMEKIVLNEDGRGLDLARVFLPGKLGQSKLVGYLGAPWSLLHHGGLGDGHYLRDYLAEMILECSKPHKVLTFEDLHNARLKEIEISGSSKFLNLYINAANLNKGCNEIFSYETSPKLSIANAVRASIAFPGLLTPVQIGDCLFGDAGLMVNFPVTTFDYERFIDNFSSHPYRPIYNYQTLACCFANTAEIESYINGSPFPKRYPDIHNDIILVEALANAAMNASYASVPRELGRTVLIDHLNTSALDTSLSLADRKRLIDSAELGTDKYIASSRCQNGLHPQRPDLSEYKDSSDEARVSIGGINTSLSASSSSFASKEKARKSNKSNSCAIM